MFEFVAIVGSCDYPRLGEVAAYVRSLPATAIVVTSSAHGVDRFAAHEARERGLGVLVFASAAPDLDPRIADVCHRLVVFSACIAREHKYADRAETIQRAEMQGKPVEVRRPP